MALHWCAAGMVEVGKQLRGINGHLHLPALRAALERQVSETVGPIVQDDVVNVSNTPGRSRSSAELRTSSGMSHGNAS